MIRKRTLILNKASRSNKKLDQINIKHQTIPNLYVQLVKRLINTKLMRLNNRLKMKTWQAIEPAKTSLKIKYKVYQWEHRTSVNHRSSHLYLRVREAKVIKRVQMKVKIVVRWIKIVIKSISPIKAVNLNKRVFLLAI
jgi:hypothetical protein